MAFEKKEIDRREMLMILGKIYAITGGRYGRIGLCRFIQKEGGEKRSGGAIQVELGKVRPAIPCPRREDDIRD